MFTEGFKYLQNEGEVMTFSQFSCSVDFLLQFFFHESPVSYITKTSHSSLL